MSGHLNQYRAALTGKIRSDTHGALLDAHAGIKQRQRRISDRAHLSVMHGCRSGVLTGHAQLQPQMPHRHGAQHPPRSGLQKSRKSAKPVQRGAESVLAERVAERFEKRGSRFFLLLFPLFLFFLFRFLFLLREQVQRDTSAADTDNDTIWIGCEKSTRKNSMVRACISALTWETLAYLALNKKIVLDLTPCGECENDLCAAQLRKELTRLVDFFGQPMFEARFTLAYEQDEAPYHVKELSRREMFEQVSHGSKSGTKKLLQLLPGLRSEDDGGVDFRLLLHQRTKQLKASMETPLKYGYYLPNFTDKCFGCGKCEKACRAGALKLEDLPDGQTRIVITPWKCSECEVCVASCSNHGIDGMKLRQLTTLGPVSIYKCRKTLCKECGKPIAPDSAEGVCTVCRIKARTKKRQEEVAARAKQLREEREAKKAAEEAAKAAEEAGAAVSAETAAVPAEAAVPAAAGSVISAVTPAKPAPTLPDETPEAAAPKND